MSKDRISKILAVKRRLLKLSLRDLERITGISNPMLSQYEHGYGHRMSVENAIKLSKALNLPIMTIIKAIETPTEAASE